MKNAVLPLLVALACLSACDKADSGGNKEKVPPPLYENPPFGASDIDATVDETRRRMTPRPATGQAASGNAQDAVPPEQNAAAPQ